MLFGELMDKYCSYIRCSGGNQCATCVLTHFYKVMNDGIDDIRTNNKLLHTCLNCKHKHHLADDEVSIYYCSNCCEIIDDPTTCECSNYEKI